ncbi:DUF4255 domain-containing protein [Cardinium endosymbiont of Culicoides punctatus]|uniref:DUF4255 domain-containing protein n=1 Tax=Cardinium endosymbiont of Culicoides punctatus TaxID=2304601 RepID=UPI0010590007|nr:DUF4255 domain-containing protein [Cardinium endosymbiont of Culicoides punctatus]TDG95290.1 hypothetical protein CCPUN_05440 [Cardinium endosymbiont of Culicoides punctatus]
MFHHCASIVLSEANRYVQSKADIKETPISFAILGNSEVKNKSSEGIIMRLIDISALELRNNPNEYVPQGDGFVVRKMPEAFSLYFLFSVDYKESNLLINLKLLAYIAAFFQYKSHFDIQNTPVLQEAGIENFSIELVKMGLAERSMLWSMLNTPYSPSLLYKAGLVFVGDATLGLKQIAAFSSRQN